MDYIGITAGLLRLLFASIILIAGERAYEVMLSFLFAMACVSLYMTANILMAIFYERLNCKVRPSKS